MLKFVIYSRCWVRRKPTNHTLRLISNESTHMQQLQTVYSTVSTSITKNLVRIHSKDARYRPTNAHRDCWDDDVEPDISIESEIFHI